MFSHPVGDRDPKFLVNSIHIHDISAEIGWTREDLLLLAILAGNDYDPAVSILGCYEFFIHSSDDAWCRGWTTAGIPQSSVWS